MLSLCYNTTTMKEINVPTFLVELSTTSETVELTISGHRLIEKGGSTCWENYTIPYLPNL